MKLVLTGATGMVGKEVLRQALKIPAITSIIVLGRRSAEIPKETSKEEADKLHNIIVDDFLNYSDSVKEQIAGADACIWMLAIVPRKASGQTPEQVRNVNLEYPLVGLKALAAATAAASSSNESRFRFIYTSGVLTERDPKRSLWIMSDFRHMRGETESRTLELGQQNGIDVHVAKFGAVLEPTSSFFTNAFATALKVTMGLPSIMVSDLASALLLQAQGQGEEKETIWNDDLIAISKQHKQVK